MLRRNTRYVAIFSLSALDLFATAMGVFLIFGVVMAPFFLQTEEGSDQLAGLARHSKELTEQLESLRATRAQDIQAATAARAQAAKLAEAPPPAPALVPVPKPKPAPPATRAILDAMDLVFVIDSTASMEEELRHLTESIGAITEVLNRLVTSLRVGIVTYRDYDNSPWVTRHIGLQVAQGGAITVLRNFAHSLRPARRGGSTVSEAVKAGLAKAINFPFRRDARVRVLVIGDAEAHPHEQTDIFAMARLFHAEGTDRRISTLLVRTLSHAQQGSSAAERFFANLAKHGQGKSYRRTVSLIAYTVEEALADGP